MSYTIRRANSSQIISPGCERIQPVTKHCSKLRAFSLACSCVVLSTSSCRVPPLELDGASTPTDSFGTTTQSSESIPTTTPKGPEIEKCTPGMVTHCSKDMHGNEITFPRGIPLGACRFGQSSCNQHGNWGDCIGAIAPAHADRCDLPEDDSNCNGILSENCGCSPTEPARECGTNNVGECKLGTQACVDGRWTECKGATTPKKEVCDGAGKDEDCDGLADSEDTDCECVAEGLVPCTIPGKLGNCALGAQFCSNGQLSACLPRFKQSRETCAPPISDSLGLATRDEDCDGEENEWNQRVPTVGCEHYMIDDDNDGWGKIGALAGQGKDGIEETHGCFCELPADYKNKGFVKASAWTRISSDCADSAEHDGEDVHPGYHEHLYPSPALALQERETPWPGGNFDYDCNGESAAKYGSEYHDCRMSGSGRCEWTYANTFWKPGEQPECGAYIKIPTCKLNPEDETKKSCIVDLKDESTTIVSCK